MRACERRLVGSHCSADTACVRVRAQKPVTRSLGGVSGRWAQKGTFSSGNVRYEIFTATARPPVTRVRSRTSVFGCRCRPFRRRRRRRRVRSRPNGHLRCRFHSLTALAGDKYPSVFNRGFFACPSPPPLVRLHAFWPVANVVRRVQNVVGSPPLSSSSCVVGYERPKRSGLPSHGDAVVIQKNLLAQTAVQSDQSYGRSDVAPRTVGPGDHRLRGLVV